MCMWDNIESPVLQIKKYIITNTMVYKDLHERLYSPDEYEFYSL